MKIRRAFRNIIYMLALTLLLIPNSCKEREEYIPYVPVRFSIDLNQFNDLTSTGFSMKYPYDGYAGVIIYCQYYDVADPSNSLYYAYDAACTLEVQDSCSVVNEGNNLTATCPCCGSIYSLLDGFPINGDAYIALKQYNISILGNMLYVSN